VPTRARPARVLRQVLNVVGNGVAELPAAVGDFRALA
jgi:hypothetical protein